MSEGADVPDEESSHTWAEVLQGEFERLSRGTDAFDKQPLETLQSGCRG